MRNLKTFLFFVFILTGFAVFPALSQTPDTTAVDTAATAPDTLAPQTSAAAPPDTVQETPPDTVQSGGTTSTTPGSDITGPDTARTDSPAAATTVLPETTTGSDVSVSTTAGTVSDTTLQQIQETTTPEPDSEPASFRSESEVTGSASASTPPGELSQSPATTDTPQQSDTAVTDSAPSQAARFQTENDSGSSGWILGIIGLIILVGAAAFILYLRLRKEESYGEEIVAEIPPPGTLMPINVEPASGIKLNGGQLILSSAQHPGNLNEQQDAFIMSDPKSALTHRGMLMILADGMSGHAWGREASRTAVRGFQEAYEKKAEEDKIPAVLKRALAAANKAVIDFARERRAENNVGTTLTAAVIENANLFWIAVGDTPLYLLRNGHLQRLTADHIYFNKLREAVSAGKMKKSEAEKHPDRDALYSFLGLKRLPDISMNKELFPLKTGDRLLLCSEGLYKTLSPGEISEVLSGNPKTIGESLVKRALEKEKPEQENITVIAIVIE